MNSEPKKQLRLFDFEHGIAAEKWKLGEEHEVYDVFFQDGYYGEYPVFETKAGKVYCGGLAVLKQAKEIKQALNANPGSFFKLKLVERRAINKNTYYNILVDVE